MTGEDIGGKASQLRALHRPGEPLVVVNVWDVASARVIAARPETRAIATASWSLSAAAGYADGEALPLDDALLAASRIVAAVDFPVTVDFEKGYGATLGELSVSTLRLLEIGAVGLNIEDSLESEDGRLRDIGDASNRVAAARAAAEDAGVSLVINARTDILIGGGTVNDAVARGRAYLDSGADCVFVLGAIGPDLREIVDRIPGPVSVLAGAGSPPIAELASAGVARISYGPGPMGVAYAALDRFARDLAHEGLHPDDLAWRPGISPAVTS